MQISDSGCQIIIYNKYQWRVLNYFWEMFKIFLNDPMKFE